MQRLFIYERISPLNNIERRFYRYCAFRQLSLFKYLPMRALISMLHFFGFVKQRRYFETQWRFLKSVSEYDKKLVDFAAKKKKRLKCPYLLGTCLTEHPQAIVAALFKGSSVEVVGNGFDVKEGRYSDYKTASEHLIGLVNGGEAELADKLPSAAAKAAGVRLAPVFNGKVYASVKKCRMAEALTAGLTFLLLTGLGIGLGFMSLRFAVGPMYGRELFESYFEVPWLVVLNLVPVVLVIWFVYLLSDRVWFAFAFTGAISAIAVWISYFKLQFRSDPMVFKDITLIFEATEMTESYKVILTYGMWLTIAALIGVSLLCVPLFRRRFASRRLRLGLALLLAVGSVTLFNGVYLNDDVYAATDNSAQTNHSLANDHFVSRGFVYPYLYSAKSIVDGDKPDGYTDEAALSVLEEYSDDDIPQDKKVNFVFIMLESFDNFSRDGMGDFEFASDPYIEWDELCSEGVSGRIVSNIFGGGTEATERSVMTGFDTLGEFESDTNSYIWYFRSQGYNVEGSHPSEAEFYDRGKINARLGFENYYFLDNYYGGMCEESIMPDSMLLPEIYKLLLAGLEGDSPYLSFNVTYQNHGPYSEDAFEGEPSIAWQDGYDEATYNLVNNYFSGIRETCAELKALSEQLAALDEPVVLVLFGDHNPGLGLDNAGYTMLGINISTATKEGFVNYFSVPYLVWANDSAKEALGSELVGTGETVSPCFLMNEVFGLCGYGGSAYMKAAGALKERVPVINAVNSYRRYLLADGTYTTLLTGEDKAAFESYRLAEYYIKTNFTELK